MNIKFKFNITLDATWHLYRNFTLILLKWYIVRFYYARKESVRLINIIKLLITQEIVKSRIINTLGYSKNIIFRGPKRFLPCPNELILAWMKKGIWMMRHSRDMICKYVGLLTFSWEQGCKSSFFILVNVNM